jgi:hypothetical protein
MNEILSTGRDDGIAELFLKVQKVNQSAIDFYCRNGFRVVCEERFRVGVRDHEALVMRLALATPADRIGSSFRPPQRMLLVPCIQNRCVIYH